VTVRVRPDMLEQAADAIAAFTGNGVVVEPAIEALGPDEGYRLDEAAPQTIKGYVYGEVEPARRTLLRRQLRRLGLIHAIAAPLKWRTLHEEDWANSWKEHYQVEPVGRLIIRPAWRDYEPLPGEVVVSLDPGMAFGTGNHPTTRMCLIALQDLLEPGSRVLDLGCGSGILAVAAAGLGAASCLALDIEEQAVTATRSNVELNDAGSVVRAEHRSLDADRDGTFDLLLANIHATAVVQLAAEMARVARPGARLLAGGIIDPRLDEALTALQEAGWDVERVLAEGEWRTVVAQKTAS
jgi:ribosomal protein L11 methyltransferase